VEIDDQSRLFLLAIVERGAHLDWQTDGFTLLFPRNLLGVRIANNQQEAHRSKI